jgi:hypothetical protein
MTKEQARLARIAHLGSKVKGVLVRENEILRSRREAFESRRAHEREAEEKLASHAQRVAAQVAARAKKKQDGINRVAETRSEQRQAWTAAKAAEMAARDQRREEIAAEKEAAREQRRREHEELEKKRTELRDNVKEEDRMQRCVCTSAGDGRRAGVRQRRQQQRLPPHALTHVSITLCSRN